MERVPVSVLDRRFIYATCLVGCNSGMRIGFDFQKKLTLAQNYLGLLLRYAEFLRFGSFFKRKNINFTHLEDPGMA